MNCWKWVKIIQTAGYNHPFILHPRFLQLLEIWSEKYGSRKVVDQKKKVVLYHKSNFFKVGENWLIRKKKFEFAEPFFYLEPLFYTFLENWLQIKCSSAQYICHFRSRPSTVFCALSTKRVDGVTSKWNFEIKIIIEIWILRCLISYCIRSGWRKNA